jgi:predicted kinase
MKCIILCGVPGSGKSTHAKGLKGALVSADSYFEQPDGSYAFDPSKLPEAHALCLRRFVEHIRLGTFKFHNGDVVVDNTNTTVAEVAPYAALALAYGYDLVIRTIWCEPGTAWARNVHGVPLAAIKAMDARMRERQLPPWWPTENVSAE